VLLMIGLTTTPASSAALLLNLEGLATMALAWIVFKENVDRRLLVGAMDVNPDYRFLTPCLRGVRRRKKFRDDTQNRGVRTR